MEILLLGTAAAEAIPNPFCRCSVCENARRVGGREVRGRSAALINDDLLIDIGPDLLCSANRLNIYLGNLSTVLVTHGHEDHWLPSNLFWREPGFAPTPVAPLTVYGPQDAVGMVKAMREFKSPLEVVAVHAGDRWSAGRYTVTAVPATHGGGSIEALLYVIDDGKHRLFYATDTSSLSEEAWEVLRPLGPMSAILLDETSGLRSGGSGHHGFAKFLETRERMFKEGVMDADTLLVAHHFSHNGGLTHAELVEKFAPYGVTVAYDGLELSLPSGGQ